VANKYRKKPIVIDVFRFYVDEMPDWFMDKVSNNDVVLYNCDYNKYSSEEAYCEIRTLGGVKVANGGDYIIKGVQGEIYTCKEDIFEEIASRHATYFNNEGREVSK